MTNRKNVSVLLAIAFLPGICLAACGGESSRLIPREITEINDGSQHGEMGPIEDSAGAEELPLLVAGAAASGPLPPKDVPIHPFLAESGGVHVDMYNTDVSDWPGPQGEDPMVFSRSLGEPLGICFMRAFHPDGAMSSICYYFRSVDFAAGTVTLGMDLILFDPGTLAPLDFYDVGEVTVGIPGTGEIAPGDLSGIYFYIDQRGRAVVASPGNTIRIVEPGWPDGIRGWKSEIVFNISGNLPAGSGNLIAVGPDWAGNIWFVTQEGGVGYIREGTDGVRAIRLEGERFENAFSAAPDGVYAASDHALYRFEIDPDGGSPRFTWRAEYERATRVKPGMLSGGTGTTPTLVGEDLVGLVDNADEQVNLLVHRRESGERICRVPLFEPGKSVVEISPIGYGDAGGTYASFVVQNNYNAPDIFGDYRELTPGLTRIDVLPNRSGCVEAWSNSEIPATTVPKLSTATGLIYTYTQRLDAPVGKTWYFAALDFRTGEMVYMVRAGTGDFKHNYFATTEVGPGGNVFQGVMGGIIAFRDGG